MFQINIHVFPLCKFSYCLEKNEKVFIKCERQLKKNKSIKIKEKIKCCDDINLWNRFKQ